jgi:hypothetical protein
VKLPETQLRRNKLNLIQEVENALAPIGAEFKAAWDELDVGVKSIAALVYKDVISVAEAVGSTVVADVQKALPVFAADLKSYALTVVQNLESNATFGNAVGTWKFGIAAAQLWAAVSAGALGPAVSLGIATVETLIQDAYNTFTTQVKQVAPAVVAAASATVNATTSALTPPAKS